ENGALVGYQGGVYRIAGEAPLYVSNWNAVGGPQAVTAMTSVEWATLQAVPVNGTLLGSSSGGVFEVAGGAPLYVSSWAAVGGPAAVTQVDGFDISNAGSAVTH